mmetsp:Transcript_45859/g.139020  ORF Transcript_45859/g.139020 Transcript_45859/m.139020 type:complete len:215 (+) Transcript_45859:148-792(+)
MGARASYTREARWNLLARQTHWMLPVVPPACACEASRLAHRAHPAGWTTMARWALRMRPRVRGASARLNSAAARPLVLCVLHLTLLATSTHSALNPAPLLRRVHPMRPPAARAPMPMKPFPTELLLALRQVQAPRELAREPQTASAACHASTASCQPGASAKQQALRMRPTRRERPYSKRKGTTWATPVLFQYHGKPPIAHAPCQQQRRPNYQG